MADGGAAGEDGPRGAGGAVVVVGGGGGDVGEVVRTVEDAVDAA